MLGIRQKILMTKLDLEFTPRSWWIRSIFKHFYGKWVIYVNFYGFAYSYCTDSYNSISFLPVCSI